MSALFPNMGFFKWIFRILCQSFSLSLHSTSQNLYCLHSRQVMSGLVWATRRGKAQTCWPRQTYKTNWETPSPCGLFSHSCLHVKRHSSLTLELTVFSAGRRALSIETAKVQGPSTEEGKDFPARFCIHILGLLRVSVGKVAGKLLHEKEVGKEITNLKWLGVSFWGYEAELCWFKVSNLLSSMYSTFKQMTLSHTGFSGLKSYKEVST